MKSNIDASLDDFNDGVVTFQSKLSNVLAKIAEEHAQIQQERQRLENSKLEFQEEQQRIAQLAASASEQVTLNVGGLKYTTTVTTLRNAPAPSLFNAMFSGRHVLSPDENGCFFVDRDGRHFHDILNFLRDGTFSYPEDGADFKYLLELRAEAEYYCLSSLVEQIDRFPFMLMRVHRAGTFDSEDGWVYHDDSMPDEVVISVSSPCQLMGVGLCGTTGAFNVDLAVSQVDSNDFSWDVRMLGAVSQSFSKADSHRLLLPKPISLQPDAFYMISALIKGSDSSCCEECLETVVAAGVRVTFHPWESPNGTTQTRGQFPELYIRVFKPLGLMADPAA